MQHHGQVHGLEHGALIGAAIAAEGRGDILLAQGLGGQGGAVAQGRAAAHDGVGAEHALVEVGDVHGAALAVAQAGGLAHEFLHHAHHVTALGDGVTVTPVGAAHHVVVGQQHAQPNGDRLLTVRSMHEAGNIAFFKFDHGPFLEQADGLHGAIGPHQEVLFVRHGNPLRDGYY